LDAEWEPVPFKNGRWRLGMTVDALFAPLPWSRDRPLTAHENRAAPALFRVQLAADGAR
jgi:hypothetical protein